LLVTPCRSDCSVLRERFGERGHASSVAAYGRG
jgi:hypothetical protein